MDIRCLILEFRSMDKNKFEKLEAWKEAHKLVLMVYKTVSKFPKEEKFRLIDQLCRAVSSVAANLVEGNSRNHRKEFIQFAYQARGSLEETKYHLLLARDLGYIEEEEYRTLQIQANKIGKLINGLITYLKRASMT